MPRIDPNALHPVGAADAQQPDVPSPDASQASATQVDLGTAVNQVRDAAVKAVKLKAAVKDGFEAARTVGRHGIRSAFAQAQANLRQQAQVGSVKVTPVGMAVKGMVAIGTVVALYQIPGKALTLGRDFRQALRTGKGRDWNAVLHDAATVGKIVAVAGRGGLETARDLAKATAAYRAAGQAFRAALPEASRVLVRSAAWSAMSQAFKGAAKSVVEAETLDHAFAAAKSGTTLVQAAGVAERTAARTGIRVGGKAAAEAAIEASARSAAGPIARAAGRFAPGLNIAIASFDSANAVAAWTDPTATRGRRWTASLTAVGSIAAATNFPIVSQVGAAVSVVSSIIGGFFFPK